MLVRRALDQDDLGLRVAGAERLPRRRRRTRRPARGRRAAPSPGTRAARPDRNRAIRCPSTAASIVAGSHRLMPSARAASSRARWSVGAALRTRRGRRARCCRSRTAATNIGKNDATGLAARRPSSPSNNGRVLEQQPADEVGPRAARRPSATTPPSECPTSSAGPASTCSISATTSAGVARWRRTRRSARATTRRARGGRR